MIGSCRRGNRIRRRCSRHDRSTWHPSQNSSEKQDQDDDLSPNEDEHVISKLEKELKGQLKNLDQKEKEFEERAQLQIEATRLKS